MDKLPIHIFDLVLVALLVAGVLRGRKHGMSEELLGLMKWVAIVIVCALFYKPVGDFVRGTGFSTSAKFGKLGCYLGAYVVMALAIEGAFLLLKRHLGGKLLGSDVFGGAEYYLGMAAGLVRYICMILVALAILNAPLYTPEEIEARRRQQVQNFENDLFSGFRIETVQSAVFKESLLGPIIKDYLGFLLIEPTHSEDTVIKQKEYKPF